MVSPFRRLAGFIRGQSSMLTDYGKRGGRYLVNETLRWTLVLFGFVFLLGMSFTMVEIVSFQSKVEEITGDKNVTISVMKKLDAIHEEESENSSRENLPYGAMAVMLDRLNLASSKLSGFSIVHPPEDNDAEVSKAIAPLESPTSTGEQKKLDDEIQLQLADKEFKQLAGSIDINVFDIKRILKENSEELQLLELLNELDRQTFQLGSYHTLDPDQYESLTSRDLRQLTLEECDPENRYADPVAVKELCPKEGLVAVNASASKDGDEAGITDAENKSSLSNRFMNFWKKGDPISRSTLEAIKENYVDLGIRLEKKLDPDNTNIALQEELKMLSGLTAELGHQVDNLRVVRKIEEEKEELLPPPINEVSSQLNASIQGILGILMASNEEMGIANKIAAEITKIEESATLLSTASTDHQLSFSEEGGKTDSGNRALTEFDKTVSDIRSSMTELTQVLSERTPLFEIASSLKKDPEANSKAETILALFYSLDTFSAFLHPFFWTADWSIDLSNFGVDPLALATMGYESLTLLIVFVMGAIGSLVYVTKTMLDSSLLGVSSARRKPRPLSWMIFRPVFGIVTALTVFLFVKALQFAFAGGEASFNSGVLNLSIFSIVALFSGLMSWQAVELVETRGKSLFTGKIRRDQWATGFINAMRNAGMSEAQLSQQIGRSTEQIQRWSQFRDKVTPELQDRISGCLDRPRDELFSDIRPDTIPDQQPLWGTGLARALDQNRLDIETVAELLQTSQSRVSDWVKLDTLVPPASQWKLVGVLEIDHAGLFSTNHPENSCYAVGMRTELARNNRDTAWLAERINADQKEIRSWAELQSSVPEVFRQKILAHLGCISSKMFSYERLSTEDYNWPVGLREIMSKLGQSGTSEEVARQLDLDMKQVRDWMEMDPEEGGWLCPQSQRRIRDYLYNKARELDSRFDFDKYQLFSRNRPNSDFQWADGLKQALISENMTISEFASLIDADEQKVNRWIDLYDRVAPFTQTKMCEVLKQRNIGFSKLKRAS